MIVSHPARPGVALTISPGSGNRIQPSTKRALKSLPMFPSWNAIQCIDVCTPREVTFPGDEQKDIPLNERHKAHQ
jgi:hypothetical protein